MHACCQKALILPEYIGKNVDKLNTFIFQKKREREALSK